MNKSLIALGIIIVIGLCIFIFLSPKVAVSPVVDGSATTSITTKGDTSSGEVKGKIDSQTENQISEKITYTNSTADLIQVVLPFPNAVVGKDFSVIGKARGNWFFEASFPIEVLDKNGKILATGVAHPVNGTDWMTANFVNFKADIKVPQSYIGPATLVLKKDNPSGLAEHDASVSFLINIEY